MTISGLSHRVPALLLILVLMPLPAEAEHTALTHPYVIHYHALAFTFPVGWTITPQDLPFRLYGRSYDFNLAPTSPFTQRLCFALTRDKVVRLEFLNDNTSMVREKGGLVGESCTTIHRLHGLLQRVRNNDGSHDWYFYIPDRRTDNTITLRVSGLVGSQSLQKRFVMSLLNSARMVRR